METGAFTENNSGPITTEEEANAKPQPSTEEEALAGPEDVSENAEETPSDGEALVDGAKSEVPCHEFDPIFCFRCKAILQLQCHHLPQPLLARGSTQILLITRKEFSLSQYHSLNRDPKCIR